MGRRLSSRAVTVGAVAALSSLVISGCGGGGPAEPSTEYVYEEVENEEEEEEEEVVARCVERSSEDDGVYRVVSDERCESGGKHSAFLWYYGGKQVKSLISKGTTTRPRHAWVVTKSGQEITKTGRIVRDGFGNRTNVGS